MMGGPPPSDWQIDRKLLKERGEYLLETGIWSDCKFIVGSEFSQQILEGHKILLAMSSPVFEAMFFGRMPETEPIAILDVQPEAFKALLEYIYTDKINLTSFEQACELCYAAKKYMLKHLLNECINYLWSDLHPKNACRAYEFAKLFDVPELMAECIKIFTSETQEVLFETSFEDIQLTTLLTIFDQDVLNVDSELDLFHAISKFSSRSSSETSALASGEGEVCTTARPGQPNIRDAIKKIRFLTLTPQQFTDGPGQSSLLSESEKLAILMNICSPTPNPQMPDGFSVCTEKRKRRHEFHFMPDSNSFMLGGSAMVPQCSRSASLVTFTSTNERSASSSSSSDNNTINNNDSTTKLTCSRLLLRSTNCLNASVLDCSVSFKTDKNICVYGIQIPAQVSTNEEKFNSTSYLELLYAHLLDAEGSRLTYTHFTGRVHYHSNVEIAFNRPVYIQKNKIYKIGVVLNKIGCYPLGTYQSVSICSGVTFLFSQPNNGYPVRDGLVRSIIFAFPPSNNNNHNSNPGINGMPGNLKMQPNVV